MEEKKFIELISLQYDETDTSNFNTDTHYKDCDEWSSLTVLTIIAMVDEHYNVQIDGNEIRNTETIGELFKLIMSKKM